MTRLLPILLAVALFTASSTSILAVPNLALFTLDKIGHFLLFGLLATLLIRNQEFLQARWKGALAAALIVSFYGAFDEFRQSLTPGRAVEFYDWLADTLGSVVAVIAYRCIPTYRKVLERSPLQKIRKKNETDANRVV